jgi:curved DNA-binding protein CbpA
MASSILAVDLSRVRADKRLYQLLHCAPSSSAAQIKAEFRVLARRLHPDKQSSSHSHTRTNANDDDEELNSIVVAAGTEPTAEFDELLRAFQILHDPESRALYDEYLASELSIPFADFCALKASEGHMGVHWTRRPEKPSIVAAGVDTNVARPLDLNVVRDQDERFVYRPAVSEPYAPDPLQLFRSGKI